MPPRLKPNVTLHLASPSLDSLSALAKALTGRLPTTEEVARARAILDTPAVGGSERAAENITADE